MARNQTHEHVILELIDSAFRTVKTVPLNLGGLSGTGGGVGQPPGGYIGQLPQVRVAYDQTEAATLSTPGSGQSLVDNLNHIRYRLGVVENASGILTVEEYDGNPSVSLVDTIVFSGAVVTDLGGGNVLVTFSGGGGSTFTGDPDSVVLTDALGNLQTVSWLKHGIDVGEYIEFGADVAGKVINAGRIGYDMFGDGYFDMMGAGSGVPDRTFKMYDNLIVDNHFVTSSINLANPSSTYDINSVPHTHTAEVVGAIPNNGWVAYNDVIPTRTVADDPTYTIQFAGVDLRPLFSEGSPIKWTQNGIVRYGWLSSAPAFSTNTTVTVLTRCNDASVDYDVLDTSANPITLFYYAPPKQPGASFPIDPAKWAITVSDNNNASQATPTSNTWYNLGSISIAIHIGTWRMSYFVAMEETANLAAVSNRNIRSTLSTANNSESDAAYTCNMIQTTPVSATATIRTPFQKINKIMTMTTKTTHYLNGIFNNGTAAATIAFRGDGATTTITLECAYL